MYRHWRRKTGCILADCMGMGKTVQVAALLLAAFGKTGTLADQHVIPP